MGRVFAAHANLSFLKMAVSWNQQIKPHQGFIKMKAKKTHCVTARIRRVAKVSLENLNQNLPEDQQITPKGMMFIAMIWAVAGVILINSKFTAIPWFQPLGWMVMIMGALAMIASLLLSMDEK